MSVYFDYKHLATSNKFWLKHHITEELTTKVPGQIKFKYDSNGALYSVQ